jgi:hypothetical protein
LIYEPEIKIPDFRLLLKKVLLRELYSMLRITIDKENNYSYIPGEIILPKDNPCLKIYSLFDRG